MGKIVKRRLVPPKPRKEHIPVKYHEREGMRKAFLAFEPIRRIAHRYDVDPGTVRYHCRDLKDHLQDRPKGRPKGSSRK